MSTPSTNALGNKWWFQPAKGCKRRHVVKVYGRVDPRRQARREADGWQPDQPHPRPCAALEVSVK